MNLRLNTDILSLIGLATKNIFVLSQSSTLLLMPVGWPSLYPDALRCCCNIATSLMWAAISLSHMGGNIFGIYRANMCGHIFTYLPWLIWFTKVKNEDKSAGENVNVGNVSMWPENSHVYMLVVNKHTLHFNKQLQ